MSKLIVVDGNSIVNRAFYGIMGSKMLQTADGTYTNAVYGFLAILFKELEEINPEYIAVAFDLKAPTARHKMYDGYKANRKGMPDELAAQMPILKNVLKAMNITIIEKEGYEADDILGTLSVMAEKQGIDVALLTGDRDSFQLATDKVSIYIPRTKNGKTETDIFDRNKVLEVYGVEPKQMIEVKGLQGDTSDNIPGVPGIGEKTALSIVKKYGTIEKLYEMIEAETDNLKGKQREKIAENKELAILSKTLGTINLEAPVEKNIDDLKIQEWNKSEVLKIFRELRFNRYIDRFKLNEDSNITEDNEIENQNSKIEFNKENIGEENFKELEKKIKGEEILYFYIETKEDFNSIIKKSIKCISIYIKNENKVYDMMVSDIKVLKDLFENENILKCSYDLKEVYILALEAGIKPKNFMFDIRIAGYLLNSVSNLYTIPDLMNQYLEKTIEIPEEKQVQMNLFDTVDNREEKVDEKASIFAYSIGNLYEVLKKELEKNEMLDLFNNIEMPVLEVLADMQYRGMYVDKEELIKYGDELKAKLEELTKTIHELAGEEFNINSPKQLGEILFEKLKLPVVKKTKSGYSTDVDTLEKLQNEHEIIEYILDYRQLAKLNSTYVEGLIPYINKNTDRIHSYFHQTVTATGRISSTEPNLQNIPTRIEIGKKLRKVFKPAENKIFLDADYSQIELRILAHVSKDEIMIDNFNNDEDIHAQAASRVFGVPIEEVTKELRSKAKAVNFGIVYGISDFGLAGQIHSSRKEAKQYIEQYLDKYHGIREFMTSVVEEAKEKGFIATMYNRRRYIPELKSKNFMVRKFGDRVAMNTPIQGSAADIMKIAMINVYRKLKEENLKSKLVLQVHDELLIETDIDEKDRVKEILISGMESAAKLLVPLKVEVEEGKNWYEAK
ncbi:MAG: DNA polymerase I [Clostridia bacterium]|jgi:DNA polymerase-1|nr:DNA polymerase I [Clostridia bacterium]